MNEKENFDFLDEMNEQEILDLFNDVVEGTENTLLMARGYCNGNFNFRYSSRTTN